MIKNRRIKKPLLLIFFISTISGFLFLSFKKDTLSQSSDPGFRVELGEEEYVMGPTGDSLDIPFFTVLVPGGIRGYSANGDTYTFFGQSLENLSNQGIVLRRGEFNKFDECGAWLSSIYKLDENHWIGWYHAEEKCRYEIQEIHMSMAFTESFDGGKTWVKPNYPNNQVLTANSSFNNDPNQDDAGMGRVIKIGEYFYHFFFADAGGWRTHLARSRVSDLGKPGTWYKYYNGSFSEPGIGGRSTPVNNLPASGAFVVYNSYLNRFITSFVSGKFGFSFYYSSEGDFLSWNGFPQPQTAREISIYPQVSFNEDYRVDYWLLPRTSNHKQVYAYGSLIAPGGDSDTAGKEFYLYYMKLFDGEGFDKRYLLRRKINLYQNSTDPYWAKIPLVRYEKSSPRKTKVSTEIAKPDEGYQKTRTLGYLLPYEKEGFRPLYDCYIPTWNDYMVSSADPSARNWEHCESDGDVFVRRIGWISQTQTPDANLPLYRCFDEQNLDHFLSTDQNCEGKRKESLVGYLFEKSFSEGNICQGDIEVTNSQNSLDFTQTNTFNLTAKNKGDNSLTVNIVDEIWHDRNCNSIEDRLECQNVGLGEPCGWELTNAGLKTFENISLTPGETKTLSWSKSDWIPGYCYLHSIYFYSTPLNSSNICWKKFNTGWQEAQNNNLKFKYNQTGFSAFSSLFSLNGTAFGINTHLDFSGVTRGDSVQDLANFIKDIDRIKVDSTKLKLVRLGAFSWDIVNWANQSSIDWNFQNLEKIDQALDYANNNGFKVILTLAPWDNACAWHPPGTPNCGEANYLEADYTNYVRRYYSFLANRWIGKIYSWSPWNEIDGWCFTKYIGECKIMSGPAHHDLPPTYLNSDEYLNGLNKAFSTAREAIKSADPQTLIAGHVANYPLSVWFYRSSKLFDKISGNLDVIGTSIYPTDNYLIDQIPNVLDYLRYRYNKPVFVLETGIPESSSSYEFNQLNHCPDNILEPEPRSSLILNYFSKINKHATGALLYQMRDDIKSSECPLFGIRRTDDSLKPSYTAFINFVNINGILLPVVGDLNNDRIVDLLDIKILFSRYAGNNPEADLDSDGIVNGIDFGKMIRLIH